MVKLISAVAAIVLSTSTLANAAPRQSVTVKRTTSAVSKSARRGRPARKTVAKATTTKTTTAVRTPLVVRPTAASASSPVVAAPIAREHDTRAEELEIKQLKSRVKAAEKAGDLRQAARDRRAMYQLEADVRADKADSQAQIRAAWNATKKSRIPFWGWWR